MYKIIGADQREYGPVSPEQIRVWIAEGRANGASLVQPEGRSDWAPLSSLEEFREALGSQPPPLRPLTSPPPAPLSAFDPDRPSEIDIGRCVSRSWELFKNHAGLLIGASAIMLFLILAVNQLIGLFTRQAMQSLMAGNISPGPILILIVSNIPEMALSAVFTGGFYSLYFKLIRGQPASMADLFTPMRTDFLQLALAGIVVGVLTMLGILACILPGVYLSVSWILTGPLIVDRHLDFWSAMELSRKVVTKRWWVMFCLLVVIALISMVGLVACCIGLIPALPIGVGALLYAYEDIFGGPGSTAPATL